LQNEAGDVRTFYVTEIKDGRLTVDGNHPFAGKTLRVVVHILEVRDATAADQQALVMDPQRH
jgi:FKBP-type peptidyl-prolyl cis-trans isomerase SlyD